MDAVWVVDDDQSIRWVLERALSKEGYAVKAYSDAREALSAFDLALAPGGLSLIHISEPTRPY